jgi:hypothetical protein
MFEHNIHYLGSELLVIYFIVLKYFEFWIQLTLNFYYPHKIMYLLVLLFRDLNILSLTLFFVYILPCFHFNLHFVSIPHAFN